MIFVPSNTEDIRRYYEGTYVKLKEFGDRVFLLKSVSRKENDFEVILEDGVSDDLFSIVLEEEAPYNMDYILPHKAVFSYKNSVAILQRIPAKQYKRGVCSENTLVKDVFSGKALPLSLKLLETFVQKPQYVSVNSAVFDKAPAKTLGVTLSKRFSYMKGSQIFYVDELMCACYAEGKVQPIGGGAEYYRAMKPHLQALCDKSHPNQVEFV